MRLARCSIRMVPFARERASRRELRVSIVEEVWRLFLSSPLSYLCIIAGVALNACTVGPDYVRPAAPIITQVQRGQKRLEDRRPARRARPRRMVGGLSRSAALIAAQSGRDFQPDGEGSALEILSQRGRTDPRSAGQLLSDSHQQPIAPTYQREGSGNLTGTAVAARSETFTDL